MKIHFFILFYTLFFCTKIFANDSTAMMAAGGLQFAKSDAIKMASEHLQVSIDRIKVAYIFENISNKDITTTIVFPLPEYKDPGMVDFTWDDEVLNDKTVPLGTFKVIVNGKGVSHQTLIRAIYQGKDITHLLKISGIPLNTTLAQNNRIEEGDGEVDKEGNPMGDFPEKQFQVWVLKAKKLGLMNKEGEPLWKKQIMYYWTQTFPAHQSISISHEYVPSKGWNDIESWNTPDCKTVLFDIDSNNSLWRNISMSNDICLNDEGKNVIFTNWKEYFALAKTDYVFANHVKYILTTGANWAGPIGNFTLDIEYPKQNTVALYTKFYGNLPANIIKAPGHIKISLDNFIPRENLSVLVFKKPGIKL
jgi:hypothetical protein